MHRLVQSSKPGHLERDEAVRLLTERAVLTRALCRELQESDGDYHNRRTGIVLSWLLGWVAQTLPNSVRVEPHASDGIDDMTVPDDCTELLLEIRDGAQVGDAFFMLLTADNSYQSDADKKRIKEKLDAYWTNHPRAASAPSLYS